MPMMTMSQFMGAKEPQAELGGASSARAQFQPTLGDVVGANVEETFQGEGSLAQDFAASEIRGVTDTPLTQDEWKNSITYREGLDYYEGMTAQSAQTLADIEDDRQQRQFIFDKASGFQSVTGGTIGFLSGIAEPKNLATGIAAAILTGGAASLSPTLNRMIATNTIKGAVKRGAVEGVVAAALTEPSNIESSKIVQGDYTMTDSLLNLTLGSILGAGLGAGGKALELKSRAKKLDKARTQRAVTQAYRAETRKQAVEEFDAALGRVVQGEAVDVTAVKPIQNSQTKSSAIKAVDKIKTQKQEIPPQDVLVENIETQAIELDNIEVQLKDIAQREQTKEIKAEVEALTQRKQEVEQSLQENQTQLTRLERLDKKENNIKQSVISKGDEVRTKQGVGIVEDIKDGEYTIKTSDGGEIKTTTKDVELTQPTLRNEASIQKAVENIKKTNKSSAYDADIKKDEVYEKTKNTPEEKIVEAELEDYQAELLQMQEDGQLTANDMEILERLAKTQDEIDIFDNIYDNLSICLTRG
jgi:preprotein translocase subunit YajC